MEVKPTEGMGQRKFSGMATRGLRDEWVWARDGVAFQAGAVRAEPKITAYPGSSGDGRCPEPGGCTQWGSHMPGRGPEPPHRSWEISDGRVK